MKRGRPGRFNVQTDNARIGLSRRSTLKGLAYVTAAGLTPAFSRAVRAAPVDPIVETKYGKLRGLTQDGVHIFKGVRYGASTAGANRFMPPRPVTPWSGVQDALAFGNSAPQLAESQSSLYQWYTHVETTSEDCLSLNVFTPGLKDHKRRPVMVWLHGGSWVACAGSAPGFNGTNLARNGDVTVVTVNHRLNAFGYLHIGDKDERFADSGNAGLLDLVAALKWVRAHAAEFGGDPNNITIFGQSGGAAKVMALMGFPAARGLFHKVIVESCSGGMRITSEDEAAQQAAALAKHLDMTELSGSALQQVPTEKLVQALKGIEDPFRPVIDGRNFKHNPFDPTAPDISAHIPMMVGNTATESTYYLARDPKNFSVEMPTVQHRLGRFLKLDAPAVDKIIEAYKSAMPEASPTDILIASTTDYLFRRNTMRVAELQAAPKKAPVHYYVFDRKTPVQNGELRSPHTSEVPFVFGTAEASAAMVGTSADIPKVTKVVQSTWVAFARTGNPKNPTLPEWPAYSADKRMAMMLNAESRAESNPGGEARASLDSLPYYEYSTSRQAFVRD
jgi:para-nitrobenzyl esterase